MANNKLFEKKNPLDAATILHYQDRRFPLRIKDEGENKDEAVYIPHWHDDIELVYMANGKQEFKINDEPVYLDKGDFLFINSKVMHYHRVLSKTGTRTFFIIFQPTILSGNTYINESFIDPLSSENPFDFLFLSHKTDEAKEIGKWMKYIVDVYHASPDQYQLKALGALHMIMDVLYQHFSTMNPVIKQTSTISEMEKKMISFIYQHYNEPITLKDIANSAHVSPRTCSNIFQHYLSISPINYLIRFRLEIACILLVTTKDPIDTISRNCGFDSSAYFTKQFKAHYGITPTKYRK